MQKEVRFEDSFLAEYYPGGFRQMDEEGRRFERSSRWVGEHARDLAERYPRSWIAVSDGAVVAASDVSPEDLFVSFDATGLPRRSTVFYYTDIINMTLIL